jgi:hypothetical protein
MRVQHSCKKHSYNNYHSMKIQNIAYYNVPRFKKRESGDSQKLNAMTAACKPVMYKHVDVKAQ